MWTPNNPDLNLVNRAVWGSTSEDGLPQQKYQVCARTKVQLPLSGNNCHKRSLTEVSVNGVVAMKM